MKNYDETVSAVFDRIHDYNVKKKHRTVLACRITAACCAVTMLGGSVWYLNRPQHDIPVTIAPDKNEVTTTDASTEGEDTTTTTTTADVTTTAPDVTTTTAPTTAPSKTEPTKTAEPSKTKPTKPTTTTVTEPSKTPTTTAPTKLLITADEPDDYKSNINESSLNTSYISGALQLKMQEYSNLDVVYAVIVEVLPGDDDAFWESTEELKQFNKEYYDVVWGFDEEAKRLNPDYRGNVKDITVWTDALRESHERVLALVAESKLLTEKYSIPYQEYIMNQRFEVLKSICNTEPIVVWRQNYGPVYFNGYYVELTAEQINILAEQGGYTFRLAMPDKIDYAYWEYLE